MRVAVTGRVSVLYHRYVCVGVECMSVCVGVKCVCVGVECVCECLNECVSVGMSV